MEPLPRLGELDYSVLQQCMHCGLCLPTCPTYATTLRERHSPRGRIAWMRRIADGELPIDQDFQDEMSFCLGCLACTTACPAGVDYTTLLETARSDAQLALPGTRLARLRRWLLLDVLFRRPAYLKWVASGLWVYQSSGLEWLVRSCGVLKLLPAKLQQLERQSPRIKRPYSASLIKPVESPAERRSRVVLLTGCVQDVLYADVNRATADVLLAHGCEVVTPRNQGCCGSLQAHLGDTKVARQLARQMIDSISLDEVDAVVSNAGGCGSHLRHYTALLAGDDHYAERARVWDSKFRDVHEFLHQSGAWAFDSREATRDVASGKRPRRVAYDESCHLKHGQGASQYAAAMLAAIPGIELVPLAEADWCCGSAGVYSLTQPEEAELLAKRKVEHILASGADTVATANPGCQLQLQNALRAAGSSIDVVHTMQLAAAAIRR